MDTFNITVNRGNKGFGLSLIHRGLDKFPAPETGIYVAKIVLGGNSHRAGLRENDKVLKINNKAPRDVNDAVEVIKKSGKNLTVTVGRKQPDLLQEGHGDTGVTSAHIHHPPLSRSGSARSLNTQFGQGLVQSPVDSRPHTPGDSGDASGQSMRGQSVQYAEIQHHSPTRQAGMPPQSQRKPLLAQQQQMLQSRQQQQQQQQQQEEQRRRQLEEQQRWQAQQREMEQQRQQWEAEKAIRAEMEKRQQEEQQRQLLEEQQRQLQEEQLRQQQELQRRHLYEEQMARERQAIAEETQRLAKQKAEFEREREEFSAQQTRACYTDDSSGDEDGHFMRGGRRSKSLDARRARTRSPAGISAVSGLSMHDMSEISAVSKLSRLEEKMSMQGLNNRLAGYIDKVRSLQSENTRMTRKLECIEESQGKELNRIRSLYDKEVQDLKDSIENLTKTYRELQNNSDKILKDNRDLKAQDNKLSNEMKSKNESVLRLRDEISKLRYRLGVAEKDKGRLGDRLKEALPDLNSLKDKLSEAQYQLGDLKKINKNLEAQTGQMEKELRDKVRDMDITLSEVKVRKQVEVVEMSGQLEREYEDRVQKALNDLREVYEKQMREGKGELNRKFEQKVQALQAQLSKERYKNNSSGQGLEEANRRISALSSKIKSLEDERVRLTRKLEDLGQKAENQASLHRKQIHGKDEEIRKILEKIQAQLEEYQNLMETKVALDMEIGVYRKLVETEEDRLGIDYKDETDSQCVSSHSSAAASPKFRRTTTIHKNTEEYKATRVGAGVSQI